MCIEPIFRRAFWVRDDFISWLYSQVILLTQIENPKTKHIKCFWTISGSYLGIWGQWQWLEKHRCPHYTLTSKIIALTSSNESERLFLIPTIKKSQNNQRQGLQFSKQSMAPESVVHRTSDWHELLLYYVLWTGTGSCCNQQRWAAQTGFWTGGTGRQGGDSRR